MPPIRVRSPWLHQLRTRRPYRSQPLEGADVVVVGGGIAGVLTTFFLLTRTQRSVTLLEAGKIAHGATGHNAGQMVSYFERPFTSLVETFGEKMAVDGQQRINGAWGLLKEIQQTLELKTTPHLFQGSAGFASLDRAKAYVRDTLLKHRLGCTNERLWMTQAWADQLGLVGTEPGCEIRSPHEILERLETEDVRYQALLVSQKGCLNSAVFTEEVLSQLRKRYPDRLAVHEHTPVLSVSVGAETAAVEVTDRVVQACAVVLCTNGYESFVLKSTTGERGLNQRFHWMVRGCIGYMAGFFLNTSLPPTAVSYFGNEEGSLSHDGASTGTDSYYYLTRRPFRAPKTRSEKTLVCIGGPEQPTEDTTIYHPDRHPYPAAMTKQLSRFLSSVQAAYRGVRFSYRWHGLMGYTPTGLRCVGPDPLHPTLYYNLGCNGVGILPSVIGGSLIAEHFCKKTVPVTLFSPIHSFQLYKKERRRRFFWWVGRGLMGAAVVGIMWISLRLGLA